MDLETCLKKMELVGVLAFATVDQEGAPQIRNISAIHYEKDAIYFFTARGKNFCRELQEDGRVQILCYTRYKEMIRMSGKAYAVAEEEQAKWRDLIFEEQLYLANVYPGDTRDIGIIFCMDSLMEAFACSYPALVIHTLVVRKNSSRGRPHSLRAAPTPSSL